MSRLLVIVDDDFVAEEGTAFDAVVAALDLCEIATTVVQLPDSADSKTPPAAPSLLTPEHRTTLVEDLYSLITGSDAIESLFEDAVRHGRVGLLPMSDHQLCLTADLWCLDAPDYGLSQWPASTG